jgi:hypothetical protein
MLTVSAPGVGVVAHADDAGGESGAGIAVRLRVAVEADGGERRFDVPDLDLGWGAVGVDGLLAGREVRLRARPRPIRG